MQRKPRIHAHFLGQVELMSSEILGFAVNIFTVCTAQPLSGPVGLNEFTVTFAMVVVIVLFRRRCCSDPAQG